MGILIPALCTKHKRALQTKYVVEKWQLLLLWYDQKWDGHVFHQMKVRVLDSGSISFGAGSEATVKTGVHWPAAISGWRRAVHGGKAHSLPIVQRADLKPHSLESTACIHPEQNELKHLGLCILWDCFSGTNPALTLCWGLSFPRYWKEIWSYGWDNYKSILKVKQQFWFGVCFIPKLSCRPYLNCPKGVRAWGGYLCRSITRSFCVLLLKFLSL